MQGTEHKIGRLFQEIADVPAHVKQLEQAITFNDEHTDNIVCEKTSKTAAHVNYLAF